MAVELKAATPVLGTKRGRPVLWLVVAVFTFLISTVVAYLQPPCPNPSQSSNLLSFDWWRYPIEYDAFKRLPVLTSDLYAVFALPDTNKVWAVGSGGLIIHSDDSGQTWTQQQIVSAAEPTSEKKEGEPDRKETVGERSFGTDKERQQQLPSEPAKGARFNMPGLIPSAYAAQQDKLAQPTPQDQEPVKTLDQRQQPQAQQSQSEPRKQAPTADSPASDNPTVTKTGTDKARPETIYLHDIHFVNEKEGWVVGAEGLLLHTDNGGATWTSQASNTDAWLYSVHFTPDGNLGWIVGSDGVILHTSDSGTTWTMQASGFRGRLFSVHFTADGRLGWVVGGSMILRTTDSGTTWTQHPSDTYALLNSVYLTPDGRQGWIVGAEGVIFHTLNGETTWTPQISNTDAWLYSVHFTPDGNLGWVVGADGVLRYTADGGATWTPQTSGTTARLRSVDFTLDGRLGWTVGNDGTLLHTMDGGAMWFPQTRSIKDETEETGSYRLWPAPWYYVVGWLLPLLLLFVASQQRRDEAPPEEESVADRLVSDRPLEAGDPDPLGFGAIAQGLSRFLRNDKTQPPLTIAITGEWGTGKSSLMNLLKADLERYGFRPVWFNAWHHQQEEQLLAALLESVRRQSVPPWWHPQGLAFRFRLLSLRSRQHVFVFLPLLVALTFSFGYIVAHPQSPSDAVQQVQQWLETAISWLKTLVPGETTTQAGAPAISSDGVESQRQSLFALLTSLLVSLVALRKGLTAFGVDPATLLASVSDNAQVRDLGAQVSFRQKFAAEFREVTKALHPRTMLVLIDDLDRCRPDKVLEVLEAINFLVSSGECYVVMGMALERVERCVGLGFKDVAEELMDGQDTNAAATSVMEEGRKKRAAFARQYLEKLINIEVPVPTPTSGQAAQLVTAEIPSPRTTRAWSWLLAMTPTRLNKFALWLLFLVILTSSFGLGMWFDMPERFQTQSRVVPGKSTLPMDEQITKEPSKPRDSPEDEPKRSSDKAEFIPGQLSRTAMWPLFVPLVLLLVVAAWSAWTKREEVVVKDSPEFIEALKIWLPVITAKQNTPRSVKRFLNRVRYLAMLQRPQEETARSIVTVQTNGKPAENGKIIPESLLVALSAMQQRYPEWAQTNGSFMENVKELGGELAEQEAASEDLPPDLLRGVQIFSNAWTTHEEQFHNIEAADAYWSMFVEMSEGIRVQS